MVVRKSRKPRGNPMERVMMKERFGTAGIDRVIGNLPDIRASSVDSEFQPCNDSLFPQSRCHGTRTTMTAREEIILPPTDPSITDENDWWEFSLTDVKVLRPGKMLYANLLEATEKNPVQVIGCLELNKEQEHLSEPSITASYTSDHVQADHSFLCSAQPRLSFEANHHRRCRPLCLRPDRGSQRRAVGGR